jgi:hypothetical protein
MAIDGVYSLLYHGSGLISFSIDWHCMSPICQCVMGSISCCVRCELERCTSPLLFHHRLTCTNVSDCTATPSVVFASSMAMYTPHRLVGASDCWLYARCRIPRLTSTLRFDTSSGYAVDVVRSYLDLAVRLRFTCSCARRWQTSISCQHDASTTAY